MRSNLIATIVVSVGVISGLGVLQSQVGTSHQEQLGGADLAVRRSLSTISKITALISKDEVLPGADDWKALEAYLLVELPERIASIRNAIQKSSERRYSILGDKDLVVFRSIVPIQFREQSSLGNREFVAIVDAIYDDIVSQGKEFLSLLPKARSSRIDADRAILARSRLLTHIGYVFTVCGFWEKSVTLASLQR